MTERTSVVPRDERPIQAMDIPSNIRPDDVLQRIDVAKKSIEHEPEPGFFQRVSNPAARARGNEIERVKTAQIAARRVYIEAMSGMIQTYVDAHAADLKLRSHAFITATFANLRDRLFQATERSITSHLETFSDDVDRITAIPNLTTDQKEKNIARAYQRALDAQDDSERAYLAILDQIKQEVISVVAEVGPGAAR